MARAIFRVYFYDRDGKTELELPEGFSHEWTYSGPAINTNGQHVSLHGGEKWTDRKRRIARTEVEVTGRRGAKLVRPSDFGRNAVLVKQWPENEWFWLIDDDSCEKISQQTTKRTA